MRASDQDGARPRRRGRPRVVPSASGEDPRTEILAAAATLIARNGLSGASTRLIAAEAGLQQPSVFYYFPSKDAIIGELLDQVVEPTLQMLGRIQRARAPASVSLFALTYSSLGDRCKNRKSFTREINAVPSAAVVSPTQG